MPLEDDSCPVWSVMIPSYRGRRFLADALESVLAQDPGPEAMQVEVVDDGSPTDIASFVHDLCGSRVDVYRHETNRGHVATFNTCIARARGELVHLLHDDDAVRLGFYERLGAAFAARPDLGAAFCRYIVIDGEGTWTRLGPLEQPRPGVLDAWHETIATGQRLQPPCMVVRRRVYSELGGFDERIESYGEDWEMWTRIASAYPVWYEPEPLALYRVVADGSLTSAAMRSGDNVRQLLQVIEINRARLPAATAAAVTSRARRIAARTAVRRGVRLARAGDARGAFAQLRASVRADRSAATLSLLALGGVRSAWALGRGAVRRRDSGGRP
jgi:hypothetical protein